MAGVVEHGEEGWNDIEVEKLALQQLATLLTSPVPCASVINYLRHEGRRGPHGAPWQRKPSEHIAGRVHPSVQAPMDIQTSMDEGKATARAKPSCPLPTKPPARFLSTLSPQLLNSINQGPRPLCL